MRVQGGGSKAGLGRPAEADETILDVSALSGITLYEPDELVLTARAGTSMAEIQAAISEKRQCLGFEPPDFGGLFGGDAGRSTLGGVVAAGLSGPRRIKAGAVRDHVLGILSVAGDGVIFKSGGRVVKNVTGFDLPKLLTGSHGTLAVLTEITIKVLPAPETSRTLLLQGLDDAAAVGLMCEALGGPYEISAAAHLPGPAAKRSSVVYELQAGGGLTALRLEGFGPSVTDRLAELQSRFGGRAPWRPLDAGECGAFWSELREVRTLIRDGYALWRLSLPATDAAATVAAITRATEAEAFYDWGGGLVWLSLPPDSDAHAAIVRGLMPSGHATLIRAPDAVRRAATIFPPRLGPLAALSDRVKAAFDPAGILAPYRLYPPA